MTKDIIGVDISDASIEAIVLDKKRDTWNTVAYSRFRLSPEIVTNGKVVNSDKLKEALLILFQNAQPRAMLPGKVFLSVPESRVFTKVLSLPKNIRDKDLLGAVQHKAEEYIPETADNLVGSIQKLGANSQQEFLYVGAERNIIQDFIRVFQDLNIEVIGLTSEAISSWSGLHDKFKKNTTLLLDIGAKTTIASIYNNQSILESININIAGDNIIDALEQRFNISYVQAEEKIRDIGLTASAGDGEVMLLIQGQLQPLTDEIKNFVQYYQNNSQVKIEQVVLIGGLAQMLGIVNYFADNLGLPTFIGESFLANSNSGQVAFTKYMNALGLVKLIYEKPEINFVAEAMKQAPSKIETKNQSNTEQLAADGQAAIEPEQAPASIANAKFSKIKSVFKNIYVLLGLLILCLAIAAWFTRSYWLDQIFAAKTYRFDNQTIVVGDSSHAEIKNFVFGQPVSFNLSQQRDFPDYTFQQVKDAILKDLQEQILSGLNTKYARENYYIIPQVLATEVGSVAPAETEFKTGQPLTVQANFKFLAVAKDDIKQKLVQSLATTEMQEKINWPVSKVDYRFLSYDPGTNLLTLEVNLVLTKK
ncbi:MAG: pilus assembly protein PilM [Patescibacteria group bacterium]